MRLVTFGCSITYGQSLPDTNWKNFEIMTDHSKFAWPSQLADILQVKVLNKAVPGAGNYLIAHQITNFEPQQNDIIIVMWSYKNRYNIVTEDGDLDYNAHINSTIGPWTKDARTKAFYKYIYDDEDALIRSNHYIKYAQLYLDTTNVKHFHTMTRNEKYKGVVDLNVEQIRKTDYAEDEKHPGPKSHLAIAEKIYDYIKEDL